MTSSEAADRIVGDALAALNATRPADERIDPSDGTPLFGPEGRLDSLGLVNLIVAVEAELEERFGLVTALADDRALSRQNSPFRTVESLRRYLEEVMESAGSAP